MLLPYSLQKNQPPASLCFASLWEWACTHTHTSRRRNSLGVIKEDIQETFLNSINTISYWFKQWSRTVAQLSSPVHISLVACKHAAGWPTAEKAL